MPRQRPADLKATVRRIARRLRLPTTYATRYLLYRVLAEKVLEYSPVDYGPWKEDVIQDVATCAAQFARINPLTVVAGAFFQAYMRYFSDQRVRDLMTLTHSTDLAWLQQRGGFRFAPRRTGRPATFSRPYRLIKEGSYFVLLPQTKDNPYLHRYLTRVLNQHLTAYHTDLMLACFVTMAKRYTYAVAAKRRALHRQYEQVRDEIKAAKRQLEAVQS